MRARCTRNQIRTSAYTPLAIVECLLLSRWLWLKADRAYGTRFEGVQSRPKLPGDSSNESATSYCGAEAKAEDQGVNSTNRKTPCSHSGFVAQRRRRRETCNGNSQKSQLRGKDGHDYHGEVLVARCTLAPLAINSRCLQIAAYSNASGSFHGVIESDRSSVWKSRCIFYTLQDVYPLVRGKFFVSVRLYLHIQRP